MNPQKRTRADRKLLEFLLQQLAELRTKPIPVNLPAGDYDIVFNISGPAIVEGVDLYKLIHEIARTPEDGRQEERNQSFLLSQIEEGQIPASRNWVFDDKGCSINIEYNWNNKIINIYSIECMKHSDDFETVSVGFAPEPLESQLDPNRPSHKKNTGVSEEYVRLPTPDTAATIDLRGESLDVPARLDPERLVKLISRAFEGLAKKDPATAKELADKLVQMAEEERPASTERTLNLPQAAARIGLSMMQLSRLCHKGKLGSLVDENPRFSEVELDAYQARKRSPGRPPKEKK